MSIRKIACAAALLATVAPGTVHAQATEPYIGEVITVPYTFCPRSYAEAAGQLLPISQNTALFALIGTFYGGNGVTTFALPDLRGRAIVHEGEGPGLSPQTIGEQSGATSVTLTTSQMPAHTHVAAMRAAPTLADSNDPTNNVAALASRTFYTTGAPNVDMNPADITVANTGGGQPIAKTSPSLAMKHCIALFGVFPSRP
jgi:microcystin-dependent protein